MDYLHMEIDWEELEAYRDIGFKRKTPAGYGGYLFEGDGLMTERVRESLEPIEAYSIVSDLKGAVEKNEGLDPVQIFESGAGRREVWVVMMEDDWIMMMREEATSATRWSRAVAQAIPTTEFAVAVA